MCVIYVGACLSYFINSGFAQCEDTPCVVLFHDRAKCEKTPTLTALNVHACFFIGVINCPAAVVSYVTDSV